MKQFVKKRKKDEDAQVIFSGFFYDNANPIHRYTVSFKKFRNIPHATENIFFLKIRE